MVKKIKYLVLLYGVIFMGLGLPVFAQQDDHLSQFNASPITLNPAMTGVYQGDYRGQLSYRTQWSSILKNPFKDEVAAFDMPKKKFGLGFLFQGDKAGSGNFNSNGLALSVSYEVTNDAAEIHHLTTGVQVGFINKSVDVSKLTFDNQYSYTSGTFDPTYSSQENFQSTSYMIPDVNFGLYYYTTNQEKKINPYIGVSAYHLTIPKESFFDQNNRIPIRYLAHGGLKIKMNSLLNLEPSFLFMQQTNVREINVGSLADYFLVEQNTHVILGAYYRWQDAFILHLGLIYKEYTMRVSYDFNSSALSTYTHSRGAFEITLIYMKSRAKYVPSF